MKKNGLWNTIKGELIYWILIFILSGFFLYLTNIDESRELLLIIGVLNLLVLETWFIKTFFLLSARKISQYSEVIQRISFKDRFFDYFMLPAIFLTTFMFYLYFNRNITLSYIIIGICMSVLLILFINVKSSLNKIYRIGKITKGVFNFVCILTFYLSLNVILRFDLSIWIRLLVLFGLSLFMLLSELQLHDRITVASFFISILSSIFITLSIGVFIFQSIFIATAIGTVSFYTVISLWNIRFQGKYRFTDYLAPLIYGSIALILIFNL